MVGMSGADDDNIAVKIPVVVFYLAVEAGIRVGIAFDFDANDFILQYHNDVRAGFSHCFLFNNTDFRMPVFQKVEEWFADVFVF